jgi:hypothetical protein
VRFLAAIFLVPGAWALLAPASFYDVVALYPPYNEHFLHDLGAFQLGLGAALLVAAAGRPGRAVALWGAAVAGTLHAVAHIVDSELGGRASDPLVLSLVAAALLAAALRTEVRRDAHAPTARGLRPPGAPGPARPLDG